MSNSPRGRHYGAVLSPETEQSNNGFHFAGIHYTRELGGLRKLLLTLVCAIIVMCVALVIMTGYTILLKEREKIIPWFIEVSSSGQVRSIKVAAELGYKPAEAVIQAYMKQFVQYLWEVPADGVKHKNQLDYVRSIVTDQAKVYFSDHLRETEPNIQRLKQQYVTVTVTNIHKIADTETYLIDWVVQTWRKAQTPQQQAYRGSFSVVTLDMTKPMQNVDLNNPLQLQVLNMNWNTQ